jgi:membrane-associated phospholipid phosphatase
MKYKILFITGFIFLAMASFAQPDSLRVTITARGNFLKRQVLPVGLILTGSLLNIGTLKHDIQDKIPNTNTNIENYLQYIPMGQVLLYDALGAKHQNTLFDQVKYAAISQGVSSLIVHTLKHTTKVQRPVGGKTSFPSGHTTTAFVGATVLYHEFKDTEPVLAYSGFVFAVTTGVLRMTNDAHWLPDVLAGAGIGILTANLVYHFKPLKNFQPFQKNKNISFIPLISPDSVGLLCRF